MTKFQLGMLSDVMGDIFQAELEQQQREIDQVVAKNKELCGQGTDDGFWFLHGWYRGSSSVGVSQQSLHQDLYPEMHRLLAHIKRTEYDRQIISQVLAKLICSCHTPQEVRDELPESIIQLNITRWASHLTRTRQEAQSIRGNPMASRQYEKVLLKIRAYCNLRLVL